MNCRALLGVLTAFAPVALTAQDAPTREVDFRIIHEEPQGGADSAISTTSFAPRTAPRCIRPRSSSTVEAASAIAPALVSTRGIGTGWSPGC